MFWGRTHFTTVRHTDSEAVIRKHGLVKVFQSCFNKGLSGPRNRISPSDAALIWGVEPSRGGQRLAPLTAQVRPLLLSVGSTRGLLWERQLVHQWALFQGKSSGVCSAAS